MKNIGNKKEKLTREKSILFQVDKKIDKLAILVAKGFGDVHNRIDGLETRFDGLELNMEARFLEVNNRLD